MPLVLASASPRRRELLHQAGFHFTVRVAGIDETPLAHESPADYVARLALEKARAVATLLQSEANSEASSKAQPSTAAQPTLILGADTTVVLDNALLGKPADPADARRMLLALSGRTHEVLTGLAAVPLPETTTPARSRVERTLVTFRSIAPAELDLYLASGDPLDKAGAYGIQGFAARWIPRIEGDYFNVVGLPLAAVVGLLAEFTAFAP